MEASANSPIHWWLENLQLVKRSGDSGKQWVALCPAHDDQHHSLGIGLGNDDRVLLKCYAGCSVPDMCKAKGKELKDLYPGRQERKEQPPTVGSLAWDKRLSKPFLVDECGLKPLDDGTGVGIPYRDEAVNEMFIRRRLSTSGAGTRQPKNVPCALYGLWRLTGWRIAGIKIIYIVEGESDCWTLWSHGFAAVGVPGNANARVLTADSLIGFDTAYVWRETVGGAAFINCVSKRLKEIRPSSR
jgi:putative DNA primase/helicase